MEDREFREILDRCLEGAASEDEERRLIEAAEASPNRQNELLEQASFDAALRCSGLKPDEFIEKIVARMGHSGKTGAFAKVMRTRLESELYGRRRPPGLGSGSSPVVFALVAAALVALAIFVTRPVETPNPRVLSKGRTSPGNALKAGDPLPEPKGPEPKASQDPAPTPGPTRISPLPGSSQPRLEAPAPLPSNEVPRSLPELAGPERSPAARPERVAEPKPPTLAAVATVETPATGKAFLLSGVEESPLEAAKTLLSGQGLRTLDLHRSVVVRFPDGTRLEVGPNTELREIYPEETPPAGAHGKRFRLAAGMIRAVVSKQPKGQPMQIETPLGSVRVLGTTLRLRVDPDPKQGTLLEVEEGRVELRNLSGKAVMVESGHFAVVATGMELAARPRSALKRLGAPCAIQDPGFENQSSPGGGVLVAPWTGEGPATIGVDDTNGIAGTKCGFIYDGSASATFSEIAQTVPVTPNTIYTVTCFIQTDANFRARGLAGVRTLGGASLAQLPYGQMTEYTQLTIKFNSGLSSSVVIFAGFISNTGRRGNWIHVDDWNMTP